VLRKKGSRSGPKIKIGIIITYAGYVESRIGNMGHEPKIRPHYFGRYTREHVTSTFKSAIA
jgi:hypothetical protein